MSELNPYPDEKWRPTMNLRWFALDAQECERPVLQQMWESDYSRIEWRKIDLYMPSGKVTG